MFHPKIAHSLGAFAAGVCLLMVPPKALAVNPSYISPGDEEAIFVNPGSVNSFGYFFDLNEERLLDALGFAAPITGTGDYEVRLWKYNNGGLDPGDYSLLAKATFNTTCVNCTPSIGNYRWLDVTSVFLGKTSVDVDPNSLRGYAITAFGNFTTDSNQVVYYNGTGSFRPFVDYFSGDGGYNFVGQTFYPIPIGPQSDIIGPTAGQTGFFNANFSTTDVPGPLPLMGAAAAFAWSKKIRRRIKQAEGG